MQFKSKNKRDFEAHQMSFGPDRKTAHQQVRAAGEGGSHSNERRPTSGGKKWGDARPAIGGGISGIKTGGFSNTAS